MSQERVVHHEERVETTGETVVPADQVVEETHTTKKRQVVPAAPAAPAAAGPRVTNVNATTTSAVDPASGNVSINTPDGTQVNING
jgi:hypothetical protein